MKPLHYLFLLFGFAAMFTFSACTKDEPLDTVDELNVEEYLGTWYEIARFPSRFEKNLKCVTATYTLKDNGDIDVLNKGYNTKKEKWETANGTAKRKDENIPGELKVTFFKPFYGDYFVMQLAPDYSYALVGSPSRKYLWILAREKEITEDIRDQMIAHADGEGFDTDKLEFITQDCN